MAVGTTVAPEHRARLVRRGKRLEWLTIAWNSLEALLSIIAGLLAGGVSLLGFGFDSLIELTSGAALLWRMSADADEGRRERVERTSLKIVGLLLGLGSLPCGGLAQVALPAHFAGA